MNNNASLVTSKLKAPNQRLKRSLGRPTTTGCLVTSAFFCLMCFSSPSLAQIERQHGAHVHGEGSGTMAFDGQTMNLSLEMPGFNVVGFEHPPTNQGQRAEIETALMIFKTGSWLSLDPNGRCVISKSYATAEGYDEPASADGGEADHDHNHDHSHDHESKSEHAHFAVNIEVVCAAIDELAWVEINLFAPFPNNDRVTVDVLTPTSALQARLDATNARIVF